MGVFTGAVACAVRPGRLRRRCRFFMVKMGCSQGVILVFSYHFGSAVLLAVLLAMLLGLRMLYLPGRHLRGHRIAHPAA